MNVEIWAKATLFPEKDYINGIAVAVQYIRRNHLPGDTTNSVPILVHGTGTLVFCYLCTILTRNTA
jgi:hypothetical protein